jgi:hypothetical protein
MGRLIYIERIALSKGMFSSSTAHIIPSTYERGFTSMKEGKQNKEVPLKEKGDMQTIENISNSENVQTEPQPQPKDYDEIEY